MSKLLDQLRRRKSQLLPSLAFLLRCRDFGVTPKFLKIKRVFNSSQGHRIYNRMEKALLRERIHNTRRELATLYRRLLDTHLAISNSMDYEIWLKFDCISYLGMENSRNNNTERQKKKFNFLRPESDTTDSATDTVINVSSYDLTNDQTSILRKGGNFAITPKTVPVEDIVAGVESAIRLLPEPQAEEIRADTSRIIKRARCPTPNITRSERLAIKELNSNQDIIVLPADKGNATVVMDITDYKTKIRNLLDPATYRKLEKDPTSKILRVINQAMRRSSITENTRKATCVTEAVPPRLYGLPKIHKEGVPLRPIVSTIGSPTYNVARYMSSLLKPHIGRTESHIKDSYHFIKNIRNISLEPEDLLVSFDVVSLFTKVPVQESLDYITELLGDDITEIIRVCLTSSYFIWNGDFYEQIEGVAMGSPLSPVVANLYMERFERHALDSSILKPKVWYRYVDDTFVVWNHGSEELYNFLRHLNSINHNIQFTMDIEQDGTLPFLDVLVKREGRTLGHSVYRKPTHTDRYLNRESNHHPCQKRGLIKTMMDRAKTICQSKDLKLEIQHLRLAFKKNGYSTKEFYRATRPAYNKNDTDETDHNKTIAFLPYIHKVTDRIGKLLKKHNIKTIYRPTKKVQESLTSAKDKRDPKTTGGIYRIPCSCDKVYIGTTKRSINTRISEHKRHCNRLEVEKSAVAEHAINNPDHHILFEDTDVITSESNYYHRIHREAIEIYKHGHNCFNKKEEGLRLKKSWYPALEGCSIKPPFQTKTGEDRNLCISQQQAFQHTTERSPMQSTSTLDTALSGIHNESPNSCQPTGNDTAQQRPNIKHNIHDSQSITISTRSATESVTSTMQQQPRYLTRSQSKRFATTQPTKKEDTFTAPDDAAHSRQRNVEHRPSSS